MRQKKNGGGDGTKIPWCSDGPCGVTDPSGAVLHHPPGDSARPGAAGGRALGQGGD